MLPSRFRPAAVPVLALLALACQDRAGPLSPERPPPRTSVVAAVCDTDADSRAHALVNGIFGPGERDAWHLRFNKGRQAAARGRLADSWTIYAPLLAEISARANAAPADSPLRADVNELTSLVLVCSEQPEVPAALLDLLNLPEAERLLRDVAFTVVSPTTPLALFSPKHHFAVGAPAGFFDETALLVVSRIADGDQFDPSRFVEYPPRFNVTLIPYTAQANFDNVDPATYGPEDVFDEGVRADVAICPTFSHDGEQHDFRVLRRPEAFLNEPTALLPMSTPAIAAGLSCLDAGQAPYVAAAPSDADRFLAGLYRAGSLLADAFLPRAAYAVDGGIGGRTAFFSDYVAARPVLPSEGDAALVDRVVFTLANATTAATVTHLPLAPNPTETVTAIAQQAVGTEYVAVTGAVACTWSSNKPDDVVVVVEEDSRSATVTRAPGYTGAAKITAVCNGTAGDLQILPGVAQSGPA